MKHRQRFDIRARLPNIILNQSYQHALLRWQIQLSEITFKLTLHKFSIIAESWCWS